MGSPQNVEIYKCTLCGETVTIVPAGFTITEDQELEVAAEHVAICAGKPEDTA